MRFASAGRELAPVERDAAARGLDDAEQRAGERRLAAARLAHEAERLARPDHGRDAREGVHAAAALAEDLGQVLDVDQRRHGAVDDARALEVGGHRARQLLRALVEEAAADVVVADGDRRRLVRPADVLGERAAVGEHARRQVRADRRQVARDRVEAAAVLAHAAARDAAQEADGVRMPRVVQHLLGRALLDHLAGVEDADLGAHLADHAEVVADEEHGRVELGLQLVDEVEHLGLDRRVEAGRRLVEDQQGRIDAERHRDHDALLHAARELVRVALHDRLRVGDLHLLQHRQRAIARLRPARAARGEDLGQLLADADRRVQRRAGVLVHHRDDLAAIALQIGAAQAQHVDARDLDRARAHAPVARQVADRRQRGRRLAAAGLADEPVRRAALDAEADAAQHLAPDRRARGSRPRGLLTSSAGAAAAPPSSSLAVVGAALIGRTPAGGCRRASRRDADRGDREAGEEHLPVIAVVDGVVQVREARGDVDRPVGRRRLQAEAEERDAGEREDRVAEAHGGLDDDRRHDVRQDLDEEDVGRVLAAQLGRLHVVLARLGEHGRAHRARDDRREGEADGDDQRRHRRAEARDHGDQRR